MNEEKPVLEYRVLKQGEPLQPGDEALVDAHFVDIPTKFIGQPLDAVQPYRRPIDIFGNDICSVMNAFEESQKIEAEAAIKESHIGKNLLEEPAEYWQHLSNPEWPVVNTPVPIADANKVPYIFFGYVDTNNEWRNAHTKARILPAWWLTHWPKFPAGKPDLREAQPKVEEESADLKKSLIEYGGPLTDPIRKDNAKKELELRGMKQTVDALSVKIQQSLDAL